MSLERGCYGGLDITPSTAVHSGTPASAEGRVAHGGGRGQEQWQRDLPDYLPKFSCAKPILQPFQGFTGTVSARVTQGVCQEMGAELGDHATAAKIWFNLQLTSLTELERR